SIVDYTFRDCTSLDSVSISEGVASIGISAFSGCSSLTSITIPDSVTSIGDSAFRNSSSLTSIIIPDSITSIGKYAFRDCSSLVSITIPDSVTSIGSSAFSGCTNLTIYGYAGSYTQTYAVDKSIPFKIVSPTLTLDMTGIIVGQAAVITFTDDEAWRAAITDITVNGTSIASQQYSINAGIISINASLFTGAGENTVAVKATGYQDAVVTQTINPLYRLSPQADEVYTVGTNGDGINTMTVNTGNTGLKYFAVGITPVISHNGNEAVVFTHLRNDAQISINITKADFYQATTAQAGFNVQAGDVVKVYIVDDLTNATDCNPILLQ
ncbi:MAG: leucine-rich repeat protein, partial [Syntrophomonas sp.]